MCQEVIRPLAVFHFPFSRSRTMPPCVLFMRSRFEKGEDRYRKEKNAERLFFLFTFTRGATFRSPDFATRSPSCVTSSRLFAFKNLKLSRAGFTLFQVFFIWHELSSTGTAVNAIFILQKE